MRERIGLQLLIFVALFVALPACSPDVTSGIDETVPPIDDPTDPTDPTDPDPTDPTDPTEPAELELYSAEPDEGRTFGGELVVLTGTGFAEGSEVFFGSLKSPDVTVHSPVIIHARSPAHKPGLVDVVIVATEFGKTTLEEAFLFRDPLTIDSIAPNTGPAQGGTPITVVGSGFSADTKLLIGGKLAIDTTVVDSTTLHAISPHGERGPATVIVSTPFTTQQLWGGFTFTRAPTLTTITPATVAANAPSQLSIFGDELIEGAEVFVGGQPVTVIESNHVSKIVVALGGGPEGPADVQVTTVDGSALLADALTFVGPDTGELELLNVWPKSSDLTGGVEVTLTAHGLSGLSVDDVTVRFGPVIATVLEIDAAAQTLVVTAPAGPVGPADIELSVDDLSSTLTDAWAWTAQPIIDDVTPGFGDIDGGDTIAIEGANFSGELEVFVGALPATLVEQTDDVLTVRTPAGTPGPVDVRVVSLGGEATLVQGFEYLPSDGIELYAVAPSYGAIAGNTLLKIYGAGFGTGTKVRFAKKYLDGVNVISSSEIWVRAPKADEPTSVDVSVERAGKVLTLTDAYSYFDPYSPYGGSWGPPIRGTVNVTVLDIYSTDPIPEAFVMLWADGTTPFKGFTDDRGQITFSGPGLEGPQMVTAAKEQHTAMSVVEYDAENITVHLIPYNPPSPGGGGGGGGLPFGHIEGKVHGLSKYVVIPPVSCQELAAKGQVGDSGNCAECGTDADCGDGMTCVNVADQGMHCAATCSSSDECPAGYACQGTGGGLGCLPYPGERAAFCQTTNHELWEDPPTPHTPQLPLDDGSRAWANASTGEYWMKTRLGELAILCFGGVVRDPNNKVGSFVPLRMGVARHVEPVPGEKVLGVDIELSIPLIKGVPLRLDGAPMTHTDAATAFTQPTNSRLRVAMDFGAEGYWTAADWTEQAQDRFELQDQPQSLGGELDGVTYVFLAEVTGGPNGVSGTQKGGVKLLEVDRLFAFEDGLWTVQKSGIPQDIHAMWGSGDNGVWAVGADGLLAHGLEGYWFPQYSPVESDLNAISGAGSDFAIAVGNDGAAAVFDGAVWTADETGVDAHLEAVWGTASDNMYAVGAGIALHRGANGWTVLDGAPVTTLRAAWGATATELYAAGDDGKLWRHNEAGWTFEPLVTGLAFHGMSGDPETGHVWLVGDQGTVIEWKGPGDAEQHDVPTTERLRAVHVTADGTGRVFAVGDRGTLLRFDGQGWSAEVAPKYGGDLHAVFDDAGTTLAGGTQVVRLGPMLSFPEIGDPVGNAGPFGQIFSYHLDWTHAHSALPTLNFVQMLAGAGGAFPAWWTVVEAEVTDVTFPNLPQIQPTINPLQPFSGSAVMMQVNRVLKPGASVHNFDFWDIYDRSGWTSWSTDAVPFLAP